MLAKAGRPSVDALLNLEVAEEALAAPFVLEEALKLLPESPAAVLLSVDLTSPATAAGGAVADESAETGDESQLKEAIQTEKSGDSEVASQSSHGRRRRSRKRSRKGIDRTLMLVCLVIFAAVVVGVWTLVLWGLK